MHIQILITVLDPNPVDIVVFGYINSNRIYTIETIVIRMSNNLRACKMQCFVI